VAENPVGTKEQREELRRDYISLGGTLTAKESPVALDGLDIAQEMAREFREVIESEGYPGDPESLALWDRWVGE
jgi:hypothetical protein